MNWEDIKTRGSGHYKINSDRVEPIDLYKSGGMLRDFALANIIKYAFRNRSETKEDLDIEDMEKIKHYADMLIMLAEEGTVSE